MNFTPSSKTALALALRKARELGHDYVSTESLLAGLILEGHGSASRLLRKHGVTIEVIAKSGLWPDPAPKKQNSFQDLPPEAQDLVVRAAMGEFDESGPPMIPDAVREQIAAWARSGEGTVAVKPKL